MTAHDTAKYCQEQLDFVYHSNSAYEMRMNADLVCVDLDDVDVLFFLICQTTYHHAYWKHTAKRFYALKQLLKSGKGIEGALASSELLSRTVRQYEHKCVKPCESYCTAYRTPGEKQLKKNFEQVIDILKAQHAKLNAGHRGK